jgi:hypothetical protein
MALFKKLSLECWYFELIHDGEPLSVCFLHTKMQAQKAAAFTVRGRGLEHKRTLDGGEIKLESDGSKVRFDGGFISEEEGGCRISYKDGGLSIELAFEAHHAPYLPKGTGVLYEHRPMFGAEIFRWFAPVPIARVTGQINGAAVASVGFHDFLETNVPPKRFPFQSIHKGRLYPDSESILSFIDLRYAEELKRPPETHAVFAHLARDPVESGRTLLVYNQVEDDVPSFGTVVTNILGQELEMPFKNEEILFRMSAAELLPLSSSARKQLKECGKDIRVAQFVSHTTTDDDRVIRGMHDIILA